MNTSYPSNLTDAEWDCLQRLLPPRAPHGELRRHCLRTIFDALFYLLRTGCPWRYLPCNFPPWQTVYYHFRQFDRTGLWTHLYRELREAERRRMGKDPHPSAAIIDAQSVKTVEESARISGFDAHKCVKGRKRHLLVDTLGLPISLYVTPADIHDTQGARRLLAGLKFCVPRLKKIWADAAYRGKELADWCKAEGDWDLEVVERSPVNTVSACCPSAGSWRPPNHNTPETLRLTEPMPQPMLGISGLLNLLTWIEHRRAAQASQHEEGGIPCPIPHPTRLPPTRFQASHQSVGGSASGQSSAASLAAESPTRTPVGAQPRTKQGGRR